jgi:hypothetical protein
MTTRIKAQIIGSGIEGDTYRVDLPAYQCVSFDTDKGIKPPNAYAIVDFPGDEATVSGVPDPNILKVKYAGTKWAKRSPVLGTVTPLPTPIPPDAT